MVVTPNILDSLTFPSTSNDIDALHLVERDVTRLKHVLNTQPPDDAKYNQAILRQCDLLARLQY